MSAPVDVGGKVYQLRTGRREQAYSSLIVLLLGAGTGLEFAPHGELKISGIDPAQAVRYGQLVCLAAGSIFFLQLAYRIGKQAIVIEEPAPPPEVSAG